MRRRSALLLALILALGCARAPTPAKLRAAPEPRTGRERVLHMLHPSLEKSTVGGIPTTLVSSAGFALDVVTPETARRWRAESGFRDFDLRLADGTHVGGVLREWEDGPPGPRPLVMASFGLLQDRWGSEPKKFHALYLDGSEPLIAAHVLILDHPTAGPFLAANGHLSVGAYDDARMWIEVARHLESRLKPSGIHLIGVSMSGQTVVHALIEDQRLGTGLFDSGIAVSIAPDFREAPGRQFAGLPTRGESENPWKPGLPEARGRGFALNMQTASLQLLVDRLFLPSYRIARPDDDLELTQRDLAVFFRRAFEDRIAFLRAQRPADWNPDFSLEDLQDFMTTTRIAEVVGRVRSPLVLLNARDDPAVHHSLFDEVRRAAGDNPWIAAHETRRGGHFGFNVSYGRDFIGDVIRSMMSPEILASWNRPIRAPVEGLIPSSRLRLERDGQDEEADDLGPMRPEVTTRTKERR